MSSEIQVRVPVIDFSIQETMPSNHEWDSVKFQVREALEEYGCFEAVFDPVLEHRKTVFEAMEETFDLPLQTKRLYVSDNHFRGYLGSARLLECMMIDEAHIAENIEHLTTTFWPRGNTSFSETLVSFTEVASRLEKTIRRMILEIFGVEKYTDELIDSTNYIVKFMKYKGPQTSEPTQGALAHLDTNMVTLLYQNEVDGLEIQKKNGEWISVKPSPNSFIVVIGESLSVWLNGRLSSTCHRVMMKGNKARYSVGLFATPRGGYQVKAPQELVDDENTMLFKPFDYEEFLGFYLTQVTLGSARSGLQAYCSV